MTDLIEMEQRGAARIPGQKRVFLDKLHPGKWNWLTVGITAIILYLATVAIVIWGRYCDGNIKVVGAVLIGAWTVGPPIWFSLEYFWFMPKLTIEQLPSIEAFKYSQELAKNFWIAAVVTLAALYTGSVPHS
jgi:hypothetical protein